MTNGFKKTINTSGKIKGLMVHEGVFMDVETGERVDLAGMLENVYKDQPFEISTTAKDETEL